MNICNTKIAFGIFISSAIPLLAGKGNLIKLLRLWHFATVKCRVEIRNSLSRRRQIKLKSKTHPFRPQPAKIQPRDPIFQASCVRTFELYEERMEWQLFCTGWRENSFFPFLPSFSFAELWTKGIRKLIRTRLSPLLFSLSGLFLSR